MTQHRPCIAIDGPVGSGKSTVARLAAGALGYTYIDTGAMYRAFAWAAQREGVGPDQLDRVLALLDAVTIRLAPEEGQTRVFVGGQDVTDEIRLPEVGQLASGFSEIPQIRSRLVAIQQEMARDGGVVMEGRDIQTVVLPDAEVKIFLTASAETRARRRWTELRERGVSADFDAVLAGIERRDARDSSRAHSPLRAAPTAHILDTTDLTIDQVVKAVLAIVEERMSSRPGGCLS
jgi:cytidylate kinase